MIRSTEQLEKKVGLSNTHRREDIGLVESEEEMTFEKYFTGYRNAS